MTRFLKLVRHQNGSWQALPTETEEALSIPFFDNETDDAPIDPAQLLKALDPLLFDDCGIKETSSSQFSSLMKKFSKKLVSRCVYVNVLKVTRSEVLEKLLDQGGWATINSWLNDAKETKNQFFLTKLLELYKLLPMSVERLRESNVSKLVKSLSSFDNEYIQILSHELVAKWMDIIHDAKDEVDNIIEEIEKAEKKQKIKIAKESKDYKRQVKKSSPVKKKKEDKIPQASVKLKAKKRSSNEKYNLLSEVNHNEKAEVNGEPLPKRSKLSKLKKPSIEKPLVSEKNDLKSTSKSVSKSMLQSESNLRSKTEFKASKSHQKAAKTELKSGLKSDAKLGAKSSIKFETKSTAKSDSKHVKCDTKSVRPEFKIAVKSGSKSDLFHKKSKIEVLNKLPNKKNAPLVYEDVKIDLKPELSPKKPKLERPKTVKSFKGKFRPTGLEEAAPLPKKVPKKVSTVDKTAAAVAAKNAVVKRLNTTLPERITEKKIRPENLLNINETSTPSGGIKLIPAKPRPVHTLQESGFFMDALDAAIEYPVRRKKKPGPKPITKLAVTAPPSTSSAQTTPTSPPIKPPKLQFYKDTLEMNTEESKKEEEIKEDNGTESSNEDVKTEINSKDDVKKDNEKITSVDEASESVLIDNVSNTEVKIETEAESPNKKQVEELVPLLPGGLRSILSHSRKNRPKKSVKWVEDNNLKQMHYFDLDETERVNVLRKNFSDLKTIEAKRERELFEAAKRQAGDKMEETTTWWVVPIIVKTPPPLVEPGCFSHEKEVQNIHQQSVLQALYFTRDSIPDSPQEPDSEPLVHHEIKVIPLDEENVHGSVIDYTSQKLPVSKTILPEVLTSLINIPLSRPSPVQMNHNQPLQTTPTLLQPPQHTLSPNTPYDPGEPVTQVPTSMPQHKPLPQIPISQPMFSPPQMQIMDSEPRMPVPNNWGAISPNIMVQEPQFFQPNIFPMNMNPYPMMDPNIAPMSMPIGPPPPTTGGDRDEDRRCGGSGNDNLHHGNNNNMRHNQHRGRPMSLMGQPPFPRQQGPRGRSVPRIPCRHFAATGRCRFGNSCTFLHPGLNGPPL